MSLHHYSLAAGRRLLAVSHTKLRFDPVSGVRLPRLEGWERLGSSTCGWLAPRDWRVKRPTCFCIGAGEDITFDIALADRFDADVYIFDPTPRAVTHVESALAEHPGVTFKPWAIWSSDGQVNMFEPRDSTHVSHSIVDLQGTGRAFKAEARSVPSIMTEFGLDHIDLLKMDIEGAEYEVLKACLSSGQPIGIIHVEYDELSQPHRGGLRRIRDSVRLLASHGYDLVSVDMTSNYTFVNRGYAAHALGSATTN